jgi:hypothetical protein
MRASRTPARWMYVVTLHVRACIPARPHVTCLVLNDPSVYRNLVVDPRVSGSIRTCLATLGTPFASTTKSM